MKKRILVVNEFSQIKSGYALYGRELLNKLSTIPDFELAELALYAHSDDQSNYRNKLLYENPIEKLPWKVYGNLPCNEEENHIYNSKKTNAFGEWKFEQVLLDFRPDYVLSWMDHWHLEYQDRSPLRQYFNWIIMPAVDGYPLQKQWIATALNAEGVLSYTDWGQSILDKESNNKIKTFGSAPPACNQNFQILDKAKCRETLRITPNINLIGTVMRNQRRKLFPDLFSAFSSYLKKTNDNTFLYCHTSYPDGCGWDIPSLLQEYNLLNKVLFTYTCVNCGAHFASFFNDYLAYCYNCHNYSANMASVKNGLNDKELAIIYNSFDLYVQWHSNEGFGIPVIEAAACGVPTVGVDHTAVSESIRLVNGHPILPLTLTKEIESGRMLAIPDNQSLSKYFEEFFNLPIALRNIKSIESRQGYESNYSWENTTDKWIEVINKITPKNCWHIPIQIKIPDKLVNQDKQLDNQNYAKWLINNVLCEPKYLGTYLELRLIKDLNYGVTSGGMGGSYINEFSVDVKESKLNKISRQQLYNHFLSLRNNINYWETRRCQ